MVSAPRSHRQPSGFMLIDVIVATILLGVSLVVMVSLAGRAIGSQSRGEELATAAALADEQLQMVLARGPDDYAGRFPTSGACDVPFNRFQYKLTFEEGSGVSQPFRVTATISWTSGVIPQSISIQTLVATRFSGDDGEPDPVRTPDEAVVRIP